FGLLVDETTATSMAASVRRLIHQKGYRRVLLATGKPKILAHLQPDFVYHVDSATLLWNTKRQEQPERWGGNWSAGRVVFQAGHYMAGLGGNLRGA
ncbi:unnamed protein product, partial [Amoebophrya sp. A25]